MTTKFSLFALVSAFCFWQYAIAGPTLHPADPFNPEEDEDKIWDAVDGMFTDEDDINDVLCKRTYQQREKIAAVFESKHGKNLLQRLEDDTSGDLEGLYIRLMKSPQAILGDDLHDTIEDSEDNGAVTEIICGTDAQDKALLGAYYMQTYKMDVIDHVKKYHSKDTAYQDVLFNYCWRTYRSTPPLEPPKVLEIAQALAAIDPKNDSVTFKATLQAYYETYSLSDLQAIFIKYRTLKDNKGIDEAIKQAMIGEEAYAWFTLAHSTENRYRYYAEILHDAVDKAGTNEKRIERIVLQTCEKYLGDIDNEYEILYEESFSHRLTKFWGGDVRGDYKDCMKKLFGK